MSNREIDICEDIIETSLQLRIALAQSSQYLARDLIFDEMVSRIKIAALWAKLERLQDAHKLFCLAQEIKNNQN